ncbi:cytochrome P450 [Sarocladium strictum]
MAVKKFLLETQSEGPEASIDLKLDDIRSVEELQFNLAHSFAIAKANTVSLHTSSNVVVRDIQQARSHDGHIRVRVNDNPIREPFGPPELPFVGNHFEIHPDHLGNHDRLFARYGSVVKTVNMGTTVYLSNDPDVSEVVLGENEFFTKTTSDHSHPLYWMRDNTALFTCDTSSPAFKPSHKFVPPAMTPNAIRQYVPAMQKAVEESFKVFDEFDGTQQAFHVYQYMFKIGGQVVYKMVLGLDVAHFESPKSPPHEIIRLMAEYLALMKQTSLNPSWYKYLPFGKLKRLSYVHGRLWGLIDEAVIACQPPKELTNTGVPMREAALNSSCIADYLKRAVDDEGKKLPHEYLLSNVVALVGAGLATTSSMLSLLIYALTHYPGNQERLLQELIDRGVTADKKWTYDEILDLKFLDCFVKEVLRLHSPSFQTARNAKKDVILPGGWKIPQGAVVIPTFPSIHKHKDHWENPNRFDPDRWRTPTGPNGQKRHRMAFTPFASGPRGCIGFNVAHLEARLVLASLVYRYRFVDVSKEPMIYDPEFLVVRPMNLYVRAVRRTEWPEPSLKASC